jgi:hypothetical protein
MFCSVRWALSERMFRKAERPSPTFWRPVRSAARVRTKQMISKLRFEMIIGNENDQVSKGQLVDALACTGDEGRDTLR